MGNDYRRVAGKIEIPKEEQSLLLKDPLSIILYVAVIILYMIVKQVSSITGRFKGLTLNLTKLKKLYFNMFFMDIFGNGVVEVAFSYEYSLFWYISYFSSVLGISIVFWDMIEDLYNMYYISEKISGIPADIELEKALSEHDIWMLEYACEELDPERMRDTKYCRAFPFLIKLRYLVTILLLLTG